MPFLFKKNKLENLSPSMLINIAATYGSPVYVYHTEKITEQYQKLTKAFEKCNAKVFYACKSLTNISILKHLLSLGACLDCVSINEVKLGLLADSISRIYYLLPTALTSMK
jgi:diaminopimelate decarboxylase